MAEWLRRLTRNQFLSEGVGSNPTICVCSMYSVIHYNNNVFFFSSLNEITSLSLILKSTNCLFAEGWDGKWSGKKVVIDQFLQPCPGYSVFFCQHNWTLCRNNISTIKTLRSMILVPCIYWICFYFSVPRWKSECYVHILWQLAFIKWEFSDLFLFKIVWKLADKTGKNVFRKN